MNNPNNNHYRDADDLLRAARSVPANISEGWGRAFPKEKISFYNIANGSAEECSNHVIEAYNNAYLSEEMSQFYQKKVHIIAIKLTNLITSTRNRIKQSGTK